MLQKFRFYLSHSINDLRVNGQRTLFALLCVAAGVAAIVSLQNLGVMAEDTLTGNLQQQNRGDLRQGNFFDDMFTLDEFTLIQDRFRQQFGDDVELTFRATVEDRGAAFTGGDGAWLSLPATGRQVSSGLLPVIVDPFVYPFYDTITGIDGRSLSEMLSEPNSLVITRDVARELDAAVGDEVRVRGAEQSFVVGGIVNDSAEISGFDDILLGLFGYYYLSVDSMGAFDDLEVTISSVYVRIDTNDGMVEAAVENLLRSEAGFFDVTTLDDLREQNEIIAEGLTTTVTLMGLLALLLGGIGIVNTMQVVVRRRTLEIAVLKTVGLQGGQVTMLFLVEAFLMGFIGSIIGLIVGSIVTILIQDVGSVLVAGQDVRYRLTLSPLINGLVVGTLVTTVFGFLPTLSAARVRPGIVLRPSESIVPRSGCLRTLFVLFLTVIVIALIAHSIIQDQFIFALGGVGAVFIIAGFLYLMLWVAIWLVGRLVPSLGLAELKISKRQMLAAKPRGAITLLALVVGVFALSTITLYAQSFTNLLDAALGAVGEESVFVQLFNDSQLDEIEGVIQGIEQVESYTVLRDYEVNIVGIEFASGEFIENTARVSDLRDSLSGINGRELNELDPDRDFDSGGQITGAGQVVLRRTPTLDDAGVRVGDTLIFRFGGERVPLDVVGLLPQADLATFFDGSPPWDTYTLLENIPARVSTRSVGFNVGMPEDEVYRLTSAVYETTELAFVLDLRTITNFINALIDQFSTFPLLVAVLGLIVGGVVIANSVALATLERRKEIAVMKSVGLQRERVLAMLLAENALLGLIGGLIGVGIGLAALAFGSAEVGLPNETVPYGTGFALMGLCILVALVAALTTAWGASGEKPLNVLRYE